MSRNRASAKQAGARFERMAADYLAYHVDDRIDRRVKTGANDKGDIAALRVLQKKVVVECKDYGGVLHPGTWVEEANVERLNDEALLSFVIAKRRGTTDMGRQFVLMEVDDLIALITGTRPQA